MKFLTLRNLLGLKPLEYSQCMIVSEQEGAEIWINGENTFKTTPSLVQVLQNKEIKLTLKLFAHKDHHATLLTNQPLSFHYADLNRIPLRLIQNHETYENTL